MYSLRVIPRAQRDLNNVPEQVLPKITQEFRKIQEEPRGFGTIKLTGEEGYRKRVGDYRIVYRIDDKKKAIFIYRVRHRKDVYR